MGKFLLGLVVVCAVAMAFYTFRERDKMPISNDSASDTFMQIEGKRGDDPLYSEEIKRNTALTLIQRDKTAELERQLKQMQQEKITADQQTAEQLQKIDKLMKEINALREGNSGVADNISVELQNQLGQKLGEITQNINTLSQNIEQAEKKNQQKIKTLEAQLKEQAVTLADKLADEMDADAQIMAPNARSAPKPEAQPKNAITYAYGSQSTKPVGEGDNIANKVSNTINDVGDFITGGLGTERAQLSRTETERTTNNARKVPSLSIDSGKEKEWETVFPVYTLPPNTVLSNSLLVTPIIGRVPLATVGQNTVSDPFYFKVEIGSDNLAANGHNIPGVAKMIAGGYSTGVREQSCVRGYINTLTFIFKDGRIVTQGQALGEGTSNNEAIGYLADQWGKPCIRGRYINNAKQYLLSRGLAAYVEAAATGLSQSQVTYNTDTNGNYQAVLDGNVWSYIMGQGIAGSASELAEYITERSLNAFDVVYVEQAKPVQIWLNSMIPIDYDSQARKIQYYAEPSAANHYD